MSPWGLKHIQPERKKEAIRFSSAHFLFMWDLVIAISFQSQIIFLVYYSLGKFILSLSPFLLAGE